jgi:hypothetical protein
MEARELRRILASSYSIGMAFMKPANYIIL